MSKKEEIISLAVIELSPDNRVRCQIAGCGKPIWKAVHVVKIAGQLQVVGSNCFEKIYHDAPLGVGLYTGSVVRKLTDEERQLLIDNTEELVRKLEREYAMAQTQQEKAVRESGIDGAEFAPGLDQSGQRADQTGPERTVICYYCKKPMMTRLTFTPGLEHKCKTCEEDRVSRPSLSGSRWNGAANQRAQKSQVSADQVTKAKAAADYRKVKGE